jgi:transposase
MLFDMSRKAVEITLNDTERVQLERWSRGHQTPRSLAERAQIVLLAAQGMRNDAIGDQLGCRLARVSKWRRRFAQARCAGLSDALRPGQPVKYGADAEKRLLAQLDSPPPRGYGAWNGRLLAQTLGVSADWVWATLRRHDISLQRRRSWCISTDPEFTRKAADIVGLYLHPPENAVVLSVDEKPHIQALERAQGWLRLPDGKALTGFSHEYKRHGTSTLFAALEVASGQVKAGHFHRRRRRDFLAFLNEVVAAYPQRELHVIVDNLNTHKPKQDRWLRQHSHVHLHFTPTHASWLNQVEVWFSLLARQALRGASFTSVRQLREAIDAFIAVYNPQALPFEWTKREVRSVEPKHKYAYLSN